MTDKQKNKMVANAIESVNKEAEKAVGTERARLIEKRNYLIRLFTPGMKLVDVLDQVSYPIS